MEILKEVKKVIDGYYNSTKTKIYIPEDVLSDVFEMIKQDSKSCEHLIVCDEDVLQDPFLDGISNEEGILLSRNIVISNIKQLEEDYVQDVIKKDESCEKKITVLSLVGVENMPPLYNFVTFDNKFALVLENDRNGGYYLTCDPRVLQECKEWMSTGTIDSDSLYASFLQEPLMMSADMMSEVASVLCSHDHMNMDGCYWYHSVWQYLRLMNMVSTPTWHHDFYISKMVAALTGKASPSILVSGAADYSTLSYAIRTSEIANIDSEYTVLDLCETPLFSCKWYAKRKNKPLQTLQKSIFELNVIEKFDLICTDAFLTRFKKSEMETILRIWYDALKNDGSVVTTVRIHDEKHICPEEPLANAVEKFGKKAFERAKVWGGVINYSPKKISELAIKYAKQMKSNTLGTSEEVLNAFKKCGFELVSVDDVELHGELYPSRYLRIYAKKTIC